MYTQLIEMQNSTKGEVCAWASVYGPSQQASRFVYKICVAFNVNYYKNE